MSPARAVVPLGVRAGVEASLAALAADGKLGELDAAFVATLRSTADAVEACEADADASFVELAALYRVHLTALDRLRGAAGGSGPSPLEALAAALSTPLGDTANR